MAKVKKGKSTTSSIKKKGGDKKVKKTQIISPNEGRPNYDPRINYTEQDKTDLLKNIYKVSQSNAEFLKYIITIQTTYICAKCENEQIGSYWVSPGKDKSCKTCSIAKIKEIVKHEMSG